MRIRDVFVGRRPCQSFRVFGFWILGLGFWASSGFRVEGFWGSGFGDFRAF